MPNPIVPKKSSTPGAVPTSGQLLTGEIAANTADGKLFIKKNDGTIVPISGNVTSVAGRTGAVAIAASDVSGLATVATSGSASDLGTGTLTTARLSARARVSANLFSWTSFR